MRAGDMDRRVTIRRYTSTVDEYGDPVQAWTDLATVSANVRQESGREFMAAATEMGSRKVIFRLRWLAGLTVTDQVRFEGHDHDIHEVRELGRRAGLELHTTVAV